MSDRLKRYKILFQEFLELRDNPESDVDGSEVRNKCLALSDEMTDIWMSLPTVEDMQTAQEWVRERWKHREKKGGLDVVLE